MTHKWELQTFDVSLFDPDSPHESVQWRVWISAAPGHSCCGVPPAAEARFPRSTISVWKLSTQSLLSQRARMRAEPMVERCFVEFIKFFRWYIHTESKSYWIKWDMCNTVFFINQRSFYNFLFGDVQCEVMKTALKTKIWHLWIRTLSDVFLPT